ncbi:MAG: hypothetical protein U5M23_16300 [Marinagarivorans sp.]|nr:hypothetical protein [Marinagarivorans sp.]
MRVKLCGITSVNDAQHAVAAGADALGLVFYPPSPRYVESLELAADIARAAGLFVTVVGLIVDPAPEYLNRVLAAVPWIWCCFTVMKAPNFVARAGVHI